MLFIVVCCGPVWEGFVIAGCLLGLPGLSEPPWGLSRRSGLTGPLLNPNSALRTIRR